jgi:hypothetical protein
MAKQPNKPTTAPATTPDDEADHVVIIAKAVRPKGAIAQIRSHLISNPEASVADLKAVLAAAGLDINEGTIKTTRAHTLAVLKFVHAKSSGTKTTSLEGATDAIRYYVVRNPHASVEAIAAWLKTKGVESTPHALKAGRLATLAVMGAITP